MSNSADWIRPNVVDGAATRQADEHDGHESSSPKGGLGRAMADIQQRADLEAAKSAAGLLDLDGLRALRSWIDSRLRAAHAAEPGNRLSERECEVLRHIALGYSNKEIASQLGLSVKTIETYKTRSMEKLGIRSRVEIVQYAADHGWLVSRQPT